MLQSLLSHVKKSMYNKFSVYHTWSMCAHVYLDEYQMIILLCAVCFYLYEIYPCLSNSNKFLLKGGHKPQCFLEKSDQETWINQFLKKYTKSWMEMKKDNNKV